MHHIAYGILGSRPWITPTRPALEVQSLNRWISRGARSLLFVIVMRTVSCCHSSLAVPSAVLVD